MARTAEAKATLCVIEPVPRRKGISLLLRLQDIVRRLGETDCDMPDAWRDPLSHPAIRVMSSRELADLPFSAGYGAQQGRWSSPGDCIP